MSLLELRPHPGTLRSVERRMKPFGVIMVLAHRDVLDGQISICMVRHRENPLKGINHGELGLPTETIERSKKESVHDAMMRCFLEELGIVDPSKMGFYRTAKRAKDAMFEHRLNLNTGFNGDTSNALGIGAVIWTPSKQAIVDSFKNGIEHGLVDTSELCGVGFRTIDEILDGDSGEPFRRAPNPRIIVSQVLESGQLMRP